MDAPRVLLYSHDGFGLGHLQRNVKIARRLVRDLPAASALLVAGCPYPDPGLPPGVDIFKLPSLLKVGSGEWEPRNLRIRREELRELRAATLRAAAEAFRPDLLIVDYLPTGPRGELLPALEACRRLPRPPKVVLGLRDILDTPEETRRLWREERADEALAAFYDKILVYGAEEIFPTITRYGLEKTMAGKSVYCGYLAPGAVAARREQARAEIGVGNGKLVVATGGGGRDAYPLLGRVLEALTRFSARSGQRAIVVTGPLMAPDERRALRRRAAGTPVQVLGQAEDQVALLDAADVVVSMCGYNTLTEALSLGRRVIAVPRPGPSAEQSLRAEAFARRRLVEVLPWEVPIPALAEAIARNLDAGPPPAASLPLDGLENVARELGQLLGAGERLEVAHSEP